MTKLHLGAFNCPLEGWTNTDVTPHLYIARVPGLAWLLHRLGRMGQARYQEHARGVFRQLHYLNANRRWRMADGSLDAIFSSHMLEHLSLRSARLCLAESHRCLRPGAVLRISVPDLDLHVAAYRPEQALTWATDLFEANEVAEKNMHHFMYNFDSLKALLREAGFSQVHRRAYQTGVCPDIKRLDNRPDSLFVEAVKS